MRKYIITGAQGSGKGTQATRLCETFGLVHISVGDILRWNVANHTTLGAHVQRFIAAGELVSDDLIEEIVRDRLAEHDWNHGFVLDGFPRNRVQAEFFCESYDVDAVIELRISDETVTERVLARRLCSGCGLDYNLISHRPRVDDRCDLCGSELLRRPDDNPDALAHRLADFHDRTEAILEVFRRKERIVTIDADGDVDAIHSSICRALGLVEPEGAIAERRPVDSRG